MKEYPEAGIRDSNPMHLFWLVLFGTYRALLEDLWIESGRLWRAAGLPVVVRIRSGGGADCTRGFPLLFAARDYEEEKVARGAGYEVAGCGLYPTWKIVAVDG